MLRDLDREADERMVERERERKRIMMEPEIEKERRARNEHTREICRTFG